MLLWLAVLVPQTVKDRRRRHREFLDSIGLGVGALEQPPLPLAPQGGVAGDGPTTMARRRKMLATLLVSVAVSLAAALMNPGKTGLAVHLAVDNCLLAYVTLLVHWRDSRVRTRQPHGRGRRPEPGHDTADPEESFVVLGPRTPALRAS